MIVITLGGRHYRVENGRWSGPDASVLRLLDSLVGRVSVASPIDDAVADLACEAFGAEIFFAPAEPRGDPDQIN